MSHLSKLGMGLQGLQLNHSPTIETFSGFTFGDPEMMYPGLHRHTEVQTKLRGYNNLNMQVSAAANTVPPNSSDINVMIEPWKSSLPVSCNIDRPAIAAHNGRKNDVTNEDLRAI